MESTIDDIEIEEIIDYGERESRRFPNCRINVFWKFTKKYPESFPRMKRFTSGNTTFPIKDNNDEYKKAILEELKEEWTS